MLIRPVSSFLLTVLAGLALSSPASSAEHSSSEQPNIERAHDWQQEVRDIIPLFGHRNWIVIADSAYPAQSRPGIETIVVNADQLDVLRRVLAQLSASRHIRPIIYTDKELESVPEADAPGISQYRRNLTGYLGSQTTQSLLHEQIISKLDDAAKTFRVLIIKTTMTIPYTSVFLQLDCAYWSPDAERRLREAMASGSNK